MHTTDTPEFKLFQSTRIRVPIDSFVFRDRLSDWYPINDPDNTTHIYVYDHSSNHPDLHGVYLEYSYRSKKYRCLVGRTTVISESLFEVEANLFLMTLDYLG